jgi:4-hydroxy-3-polyprenylbenzoate decarboxylase
MAEKSLISYINELETKDELVRIKDFVDPILEITEISDRIMKQDEGGKALLFENNGTDFPVLINHYGSDKRMCMSLGISDYDEPGRKMEALFHKFLKPVENIKSKISLLPDLLSVAGWMPKKKSGKGACQEIIHNDPDLRILPILKCWPYDGGRFITLPIVITQDPETGIRNIGMYRMQVYDNKSTGMHWHLHKGGAAHFEKYKKLGKKMPVTVVLGGDPVLTYSSTAPLPENVDEFMLAGFLRNKSVKLVKSITNNIYIPADADIVIEGYIDPREELKTEGPFGDHTGFYSLKGDYPVFHVTCITHKKNAVYPATIVGVPPMEDYYIGKATERIFLKPIQISIAPEIIDIRLPGFGVAHNLVLVKAKLSYPGQAFKIMNALLGAGQMMFTKVIVCFNENVNIHDDKEVFNIFMRNIIPPDNVIIGKGPSDVLDHASYSYTFGGKLIIDASVDKTNPYNEVVVSKSDSYKLVYKNKGLLIIGVDKCKNGNLKKFAENLLLNEEIRNPKILIILDDFYGTKSLYLLAWIVLNNIDASKDCQFINGTLIIDASAKTKTQDGFERDWPNITSMNKSTIEKVDELWGNIFSETLINSPSLKYIEMLFGKSEVLKK